MQVVCTPGVGSRDELLDKPPTGAAVWRELRVYAANHLPAFLLVEGVRHLGAVVYLPGVGYLVNDPEVGRAVLEDSDAFTKTGPGNMGSMITQVVGENALVNMEESAHQAMTAKLHDLFSAAYFDVVSREVLAESGARLRRELLAGREVDLVRFMRRLSGKIDLPHAPRAWRMTSSTVSRLRR
jgi:cytochrome P450